MSKARQLIDEAPVSRLQKRVLIACIVANMAEGYDLLSMALAVVPLSDLWELTGTQTGTLLAMSPVGMAVGAVVLAPMSDRFGRRKLLITSLCMITIFTALSALAGDMDQLMVARLLAGVGMGGMLPLLTITTGEFAPTRKRAAAIGLMGAGMPLGSAVGGAVAALLMARTGWQSAFVLGAIITAGACLFVVTSVPETPDFLAARNTEKAKQKLADLLARMDIDPAALDSAPATAATTTASLAGIEQQGEASLRSWKMVVVGLLFLCVVTTYSFSTMWLPKLLVNAGLSADGGYTGVLLLTLGAAAAGVLLAALSLRYSVFVLVPAFAVLSAILLGVFSIVSTNLTPALAVAPLLGLVQSVTGIGVYALVPLVFGASNRSAAMGIGIGLSRIAIIIMPLGIGVLIDRMWSPESLFQLMIVPTLLTAALVFPLWRERRARVTTEPTAVVPTAVVPTELTPQSSASR